MKKQNLLTKLLLLCIMIVGGVNGVWADTKVGITTTSSTTSGATGTARTVIGADHLTVTHQLNSGTSGALSDYSGSADAGSKELYYSSSTKTYSLGLYKWNKDTSGPEIITANNYVGFQVVVGSGYKYSLSNLTFQIARNANFTYKLVIRLRLSQTIPTWQIRKALG